MSITIPTVSPGDLIKADTWNNLIRQLIALDARVTALESITPGSGGAFAITGLSQTTVHVGDSLTVYGVHFGPLLTNSVWINSGAVPTSAYDPLNSNSGQLTFRVPGVLGIGLNGAMVTMQISTPNGSDQRQFFLAPAVLTIPTGRLDVGPPQWPSSGVSAGAATVTFSVVAEVNMQETYIATATTTLGTAIVVDASNQPISQVTLPAMNRGDAPIPVRVQLTLPAAGSGQVSLQLKSIKNPGGVSGGSAMSATFTVGSASPQPGNITFQVTQELGNPAGTAVSGSTIVLGGASATFAATLNLPPLAPTNVSYTVQKLTFDDNSWSATADTTSVVPGTQTGGASFGFTVTRGLSPTLMHLSVICTTDNTFFGNQAFAVKAA